jgi:hypothetical protein
VASTPSKTPNRESANRPRVDEAQRIEEGAPRRVLLFTGHMIDAPTRTTPRFPREKADVAQEAIREAVLSEQKLGPIAHGIAGGACGGDILFHQVCEELGISTSIFLAQARDEYVKSSVAHAGREWIQEFDRLCATRPVHVLSHADQLPTWVHDEPDYTIWQRSNLWMVSTALAAGGQNLTLIALWNREGGDGPGGTADMVDKAREHGARTIVLDTNEIFR